jgi:hypothetical protein
MSEKYPKKRAYATGKLYKFLKEKGVYKQFAYNCKKQKRKHGQKDANDFMHELYFVRTPEGHTFWYKLAEEFNEQT